jgi:hypothetical protein
MIIHAVQSKFVIDGGHGMYYIAAFSIESLPKSNDM